MHILSEFVAGHATVIMTLYSYHLGPHRIREALTQAQAKIAEEDVALEGLVELHEKDPAQAKHFLIANPEYNGEAYLALHDAREGLWRIDHAGICPGALCEEGGLDENGNPYPGSWRFTVLPALPILADRPRLPGRTGDRSQQSHVPDQEYG